jgi:hypothetical protein
MSREVQGDAPADAAVATATRTSGTPAAALSADDRPPPGADTWLPGTGPLAALVARWDRYDRVGRFERPGKLGGGALRGPGSWRAPTSALAVLLVGVLGWLAAGAWQPTSAPPSPEAVTASVVDARADGDRPTPIRGRMRVVLQNSGDHPVSVVGFEPALDSGFVLGLDPRRLEVPAGGRADLVLQFAVRCGEAGPLDLPGLRVRRPDGGLRPVPLTGATAALAGLCAGWDHQEPLVVDTVARDGERLALRLRVPGGRSTRIDEVRAGAVRLRASDLPTTVDGGGTTVWLLPPDSCPVRWQQTGIPRTLVVQADLGGPATLTLTVGSLMSEWILDTVCTPAGAG